MQLRKGGSCAGGGKQGPALILTRPARGAGGAGTVSGECMGVSLGMVHKARESARAVVRAAGGAVLDGLRRSLAGRRVHHKKKTLLSGGQLGDVVFGVCSADVLLHRAVSLFLHFRDEVSAKVCLDLDRRQRKRRIAPKKSLSLQCGTSCPMA